MVQDSCNPRAPLLLLSASLAGIVCFTVYNIYYDNGAAFMVYFNNFEYMIQYIVFTNGYDF